jgi:hypothetical protein
MWWTEKKQRPRRKGRRTVPSPPILTEMFRGFSRSLRINTKIQPLPSTHFPTDYSPILMPFNDRQTERQTVYPPYTISENTVPLCCLEAATQ